MLRIIGINYLANKPLRHLMSNVNPIFKKNLNLIFIYFSYISLFIVIN